MGVYAKTPGGNISDSDVLNLVYVDKQADGTYKVTKSREYIDTAMYARFAEQVKQEALAAASA